MWQLWSFSPSKAMSYLWQRMFQVQEEESFLKLCQSSDKKPGGGVSNSKCFSRKDVHAVEKKQSLNDTDIVEFKQIQFSTPVFNSRKDSPDS